MTPFSLQLGRTLGSPLLNKQLDLKYRMQTYLPLALLTLALVKCVVMAGISISSPGSKTGSGGPLSTQEFMKLGELKSLMESYSHNDAQDTLDELNDRIELAWKKELDKRRTTSGQTGELSADEEEGQFLVVALNELREFKAEMKRRNEEEQRRREAAKGRRRLGLGDFFNLVGRIKEAFQEDYSDEHVASHTAVVFPPSGSAIQIERHGPDLEVDKFIKEAAKEREAWERAEREAEELRKAKSYADYVTFVRRHNDRLKEETLESIKQRTEDYVRSLFVNETKDLAIMMVQQKITQQKIDFSSGRANELLAKTQMNFVAYVLGLQADVLRYIFGRKVLPKQEGEEEHPMNWMVYNWID